MKNKIKQILEDRADKMSSDNNIYFLEIEEYTSVLNSLKFFYKGNKNILNTSNRYNRVHKYMEDYAMTGIEPTVKLLKDIAYVGKGIRYLYKQVNDGWEILSVEQLMYDTQEKIVGTADLILIKKKLKYCPNECLYAPTYCKDCEYDYIVKIVGWETDELKASDYAQINVYKYLLKKSLGNDLKKQITIETELVSLEPQGELND